VGALAERYFRDDPGAAIFKLRQFAKLLSRTIAAHHALYLGERETFEETLRRLSYERKTLRAKPVPEGRTVFAKIDEALRLNRRAITACQTILDNNCMALVPNRDRIQPRYLFWFMQTVDLSPLAVGTAVSSVRRGDVAAIRPSGTIPSPGRILLQIRAALSRKGRGRNNVVRARGTFRNCLCRAGLLRYHLAVTAA
jgi:hypothetical protein